MQLLKWCCVLSVAAVTGYASQLVPRGYVLLEEATSLCGEGYLYTVRKGEYTEEQTNWLQSIIRFRFGDSMGDYPVSFQLHVSDPVAWDDMEALLKIKKFVDWIGSDLVDKIRELGRARSDLRAEAKALPHCRSDHCEEFFLHPTVKQYTRAESNLGEALASKFKISEIDNMVDCN